MSAIGERPGTELEREVIEWLDGVYSEAEAELVKTPEYMLTTKIIDYVHGRQWSAKSRFGRSRPVKNRFFRQFIEAVGMLTDIEPEFQINIPDKIAGHSKLQTLLNKMITHWAEMSDFEMELSQVVMFGLIHTGYAKVQWNSALNGGIGANEFQPISPVNLMVVGAASKLQQAECIIHRKVVTMNWLIRKYGDIAKQVKPDSEFSDMPGMSQRPSRITRGSWSRLSPALRNMLGTKTDGVQSKYPHVILKEFWIKDDSVWRGSKSIVVGRSGTNWCYTVEPGMPLWPRGRVVATAGGKVMEDTCNPYWHALFPFGQYRPYRVPWQMSGLSLLEPLMAMQNIINRIGGGVMDCIQQAIEPGIIAPVGAFSQQNRDSIDTGAAGGKYFYNNNSPAKPEFRKPPELPNYVMMFEQDVEKEQDMTSGSSAASQALAKKQVPGGDSLEKIMNSRSTGIRLAGRSLHSFLVESGTLVTSNLLQFADSRHRVALFGADGLVDNDFDGPLYGNTIPDGMTGEQFVRKVRFGIKKGSLLAIEKEEKLPIAFALRKTGDLSRKNLFRLLDSNIDTTQNEQELKEEAAEKIALAAAAGAAAPHGGKKH